MKLVRALHHLHPDHRVGAAAGCPNLGLETALRQPGIDRLDVHGALPLHADRPKLVDDVIGRLSRNIGEDEIAHRSQRRPAQHRKAAHRRVGFEPPHDVVTQIRGCRNSQMEHVPILTEQDESAGEAGDHLAAGRVQRQEVTRNRRPTRLHQPCAGRCTITPDQRARTRGGDDFSPGRQRPRPA